MGPLRGRTASACRGGAWSNLPAPLLPDVLVVNERGTVSGASALRAAFTISPVATLARVEIVKFGKRPWRGSGRARGRPPAASH